MAEDKKHQGQGAEESIRHAEKHLGDAEKVIRHLGDTKLADRIKKNQESVTETRQDLSKKLGPKQG